MEEKERPAAKDPDEEFPLPFEDRFGTVIELKAKDPGDRMFAIYPTREYVRRRSVRYGPACLIVLGLTLVLLVVRSLISGQFEFGSWVLVGVTVLVASVFGLYVWNQSMRAALTLTIGRTVHLRIATVRLTIDPRIGEKLGLERAPNGRLWRIYRTSYGYRSLKFKLAVEAFPKLADFFGEKLGERFEEIGSAGATGC